MSSLCGWSGGAWSEGGRIFSTNWRVVFRLANSGEALGWMSSVVRRDNSDLVTLTAKDAVFGKVLKEIHFYIGEERL
jgi:hypothetical protein